MLYGYAPAFSITPVPAPRTHQLRNFNVRDILELQNYHTTNRSDGPERLGCLFPTGSSGYVLHYLRRGTPAVPRGRRTVN